MLFQYPLVSIFSILALVLVLIVTGYTLKNLKNDSHKYLLYLEILATCLLISYILDFSNIPLLTDLGAYCVFMFFTLMSWVFLYFILVYFYKDKIKGSKWIYLIFIISVIAFIGGLTNPWLHLVYVPIVTSTGIVF